MKFFLTLPLLAMGVAAVAMPEAEPEPDALAEADAAPEANAFAEADAFAEAEADAEPVLVARACRAPCPRGNNVGPAGCVSPNCKQKPPCHLRQCANGIRVRGFPDSPYPFWKYCSPIKPSLANRER